MATLSIVRPQRDSAPLRFGEPFEVAVDLDLDEPWFKMPSLGSKVQGAIDGEPDPAVTFKLVGPDQVKALANGRADVKDTNLDDHAGPPLRQSKAGRGHEVIVTSGPFQLSYSHLRRGSGKTGFVKAGEAIGQAGNTGRCVDGKNKHYVRLAGRTQGSAVRFETLTEPIVIEARLNSQLIGAPLEVPPGEVRFRGLKLEPILCDPEKPEAFKAGENELQVIARRSSKTLIRASAIPFIEG